MEDLITFYLARRRQQAASISDERKPNFRLKIRSCVRGTQSWEMNQHCPPEIVGMDCLRGTYLHSRPLNRGQAFAVAFFLHASEAVILLILPRNVGPYHLTTKS